MVLRLAALGVGLGMSITSAFARPAPACDRACMNRALDDYIAALIAHSAARASILPALRSTENGVLVKIGDGLWRSLEALGPIQRRYFDPVSHQAALFGVVTELGRPALLSMRVKFEGARIAESEAIVARKGELLYNPAGPAADPPRPEPLPPKVKPATRAALLAAANAYFDALSGSANPVPHVEGCVRLENGTKVTRSPGAGAAGTAAADEMARGDCTFGLTKMPISAVAHRRFVVDSKAGVVLGIGLFQRPPGATWRDGSPRKRNLIHEYFIQEGGKIAQIYAVMHYIEASEPDSTGW